jgi:biotin operon repressor/ParB-like chromosome segregation protein Spo0J
MAQGVKVDEKVHHHIVRLAQQGKTGNQIAKALGIARSTVQEHLKRLREDVGANHGQGHVVPADADHVHAPPGSEPLPVALVIDPEFHGLIPALTGEERAQLARSLREEGCRDPLVVWPQPEGVPILLDGHNRHEICQQYGLAFAVVEARGISTRDDAIIWIINNQLGRRNLTAFQRIELAERLRPLVEARAKANQQLAGGAVPQKVAEPVETRQAIAEIAGVSRETVRKAEVIMTEADEPTKESLRRGKRKIHSVYQGLRGPRTASKRKAVAEASATAPGAPMVMEPGLRVPMAERLIGLAGAILEELASWRRQYPKDPAVGAFALMEKHLSELQGYFRKKQHEMAEQSSAVEVAATGPTGQ